MRYILLFLLFYTSTSIAQTGGLSVHLRNGKIISTAYVYLYSSGYSNSYLIIHERKGEKIMIGEVDHVEGKDQHGEYRYIKSIQWGREVWAERSFKSDRIEIYNMQFATGTMQASQKFKNCVYKKDGGDLKSLKLKHLKADVGDNQESLKHLKKGKSVAVAQTFIYIGAYTLITAGIVDLVSDTNTDDTLGSQSNSIEIPPLLIAGTAMVYVPMLLNSAKKKHYIEALRVYE